MSVILWRLVNNILINSQMKLDSLLLTEKEKEKLKNTRFVWFSSQSVFVFYRHRNLRPSLLTTLGLSFSLLTSVSLCTGDYDVSFTCSSTTENYDVSFTYSSTTGDYDVSFTCSSATGNYDVSFTCSRTTGE